MNDPLPPETLFTIFEYVGRRPQIASVCRLWRDVVCDDSLVRCRPPALQVARGVDYAIYLARQGLIDLLQWAYDQGCPMDDRVMVAAIYKDHRDVFEWALHTPTLAGPRACAAAARLGRLDLLRALYDAGWPLDSTSCRQAASGGHLEVLAWLRAQECPWDPVAPSKAASGGHWQVFDWLLDQECPYDQGTMAAVAGQGDILHLEILRVRGCSWDSSACEAAARGGHLKVLQWLRDNGCPWSRRSPLAAARGGHLPVLKWLQRQGCPWNLFLGKAAYSSGNRDTIKWVIKHRWGDDWFEPAVASADLDLIGWALSSGHCDGYFQAGRDRIAWEAARTNNKRVIQWLRDTNSVDEFDTRAMCGAALGGHLDLVEWLYAAGFPWDCQVTYEAAKGKHYRLLEWLVDHGCLSYPYVISFLISDRQFDMARRLHAKGCPLQRRGSLARARRAGADAEFMSWLEAHSI